LLPAAYWPQKLPLRQEKLAAPPANRLSHPALSASRTCNRAAGVVQFPPMNGQFLARRVVLSLLAACLTVTAAPLSARQAPEPVTRAVDTLLQRETAGLPGETVLTVSPLDAANQLPPCSALEAFLPPGGRAWGRFSVGVRCLAPVAWTVFLSAQVEAMTQYLVIAQPLKAGQIVGPDDITLTRGDLAAQPDGTMTDPAQAIGQRARYAVAAGQTLRSDMLRLPPTVRQGQNVRIVGSGEGFVITNEGRALNNAAEGETVRIKLANGKTVSGIARRDGTVAVEF